LLTTKISVRQLFFGKFLGSVSRGFVQTLILLVLSALVFHFFTPLTFLEALVITIIFAAAGAALGLVIASISRSREQANWISVAFTMVMTMLGGTFFTITPGSTLDAISKISINTYANNAFKTVVAQTGTLANVGLEMVVLAGVAIVALLISRALFKLTPGGR
jgi:ABC-2 type transport system permease protein